MNLEPLDLPRPATQARALLLLLGDVSEVLELITAVTAFEGIYRHGQTSFPDYTDAPPGQTVTKFYYADFQNELIPDRSVFIRFIRPIRV